MSLGDTFESFKKAGIQATPVPGTSRYHISFPDGQVMDVREKTLIRLARLALKEPVAMVQALRELQASQKEKEVVLETRSRRED